MADVPAVQNIEDVDIGAGSEFWLENEDGDMQELAMVIAVPASGEEDDLVEVTHMKSPGRRKEFIGGWGEGDEEDVVMNYVPGSDTDVLCRWARAKKKPLGYRAVLPQPDGSTWEISGKVLVRRYKPDNPIEGRRTATMTVKFTGAETQAAGA